MFISKLLSLVGKADEPKPLPTRFIGVVQGNKTLSSYNRRFRTLQTKLQASQAEACGFYLLGLDPSLSDFLAHHDLPEELEPLIKEVSKWERKMKKPDIKELIQQKSVSKDISKFHLHQPSTTTTSTNTRSAIPATKPAGTEVAPDWSFKVTMDEYLRRKNNSLCSYCGSDKHLIANCDHPNKKQKTVTNIPPSSSINFLSLKGDFKYPVVRINIHGPLKSLET